MLKHLAGWLLQSTLIEYILGPNCHPEIIAESANIVGFLVVTKTYEQQHTDRLWYNVTCSQDPRVSDALVRMITTIINIFEQDHLLAFCDKFQGLAVDAFTASIRNLWTTIISQLMDKAQKEHTILTYQPYDLCMKLLRQSSMLGEVSQVAHPEMQCLVMQKFRDLLSYGPDNEGRTQLYVSCLDDVSKKSPTSLGSLWCLLISIRPVMEREVQVLTREYDLPRLIIDELNAAVDASRATLSSPTVLWGNSNQPRREFLLSIIQFQAETIDEALGKKLWDLLVGPLSPSANDRLAGWQILNEVVVRSASKNPFIRTCLAQHLPCLPPSCFCEGQLDFIKQEVMKLLDVNQNFQLDEEEVVKSSCLEHLWTIILTADEPVLAGQAIHFLIVDIYAAASVVAGLSSRRLHQAHSILVNRCFVQLKEAASHIQAADTIDDSGHDGEAMVIVQSDDHLRRHERVFTRSLQLLRYFLDVYQTRPDLSAPDLRALMSQVPSQIEGDPAQLKYQSFDGDRQTEVKPLSIGKRNTAASLLASLRMETGFQNYRAYYRGQPFQPDVRQICKSLEDLQVHEGLILVQRADENDGLGAQRVKIGASVLQIDILHHFDELWEYLDLKESLAQEVRRITHRIIPRVEY
jgi:ubiquitin carboxyl-terminal hydrolase 34